MFKIKKLSKILTLLILIILLLHHKCLSSDIPDMLLKGAGARPCGMGQSFVAISDDVNANYFNPAGLGFLRNKTEITTLRTSMSDFDTTTYFLGGVFKIGRGGIGINVVQSTIGNILQTVTVNNRPVILGVFTEKELGSLLSY